MRELKFRAYWPNVNEMRYFVEGHFIDTPDGWMMGFKLSNENKDDNIFISNAEIMQYTGIKDKNGKEIYEGDCFQNGSYIGVIEYNETNAMFIVKTKGAVSGMLCEYSLDIEIIGNIYESPNILNS